MELLRRWSAASTFLLFFTSIAAHGADSSINIQCPTATDLHPTGEGIVCDHLVGGDGMVTMADEAYENDDGLVGGKKMYIFSFARLQGDEDSNPLRPPVNTSAYAGWVMEEGILAANAPAPTIMVDEGDELYLTLSNVGMAMRPDLFDPHTIHWHGFPQAAPIFDGVPDASISVNMGASLTYYYKVSGPGTYMYHCHVEAAEHMQMGMNGNLYVRPAQNKLAPGTTLGAYTHQTGNTYTYNDGDGSTRYDVDAVMQIGSFDPDFHDASLNVQPLPFADMRDRYFMLNGRGYPDTVNPASISTVDPLGTSQASQQVSSLITATAGQRVLVRISNLSVTNFYSLGTSGLPMEVVGLDARLLRDGDGANMYYKTNSLTLGGGQSADVIIDTTDVPAGTYFLYTKNLDQLANDKENFGGMMTEIRITL